MANLIRGLSENGGVVFCGVDSTQIVRKAEKLHTTIATCSAALGRLLTGAALMGSMLKDDRDQITLRVSGGGPAGVVIACTDGTGNVKGCIDHPLVEPARSISVTEGMAAMFCSSCCPVPPMRRSISWKRISRPCRPSPPCCTRARPPRT